MDTTRAYLYCWTHLPTQKWYIGSRTKKGCHPGDGYICSSSLVQQLIRATPHEWVRTVLCVGDPVYIRQMENLLLEAHDAMYNPASHNKTNGQAAFTTTGKQLSEATRAKMSAARLGVPRPASVGEKCRAAMVGRPKTEEQKAKQSATMKGRVPSNKGNPHTDETKQKISSAAKTRGPSPLKGRPKTEEQKAKQSAAMKERHRLKQLETD